MKKDPRAGQNAKHEILFFFLLIRTLACHHIPISPLSFRFLEGQPVVISYALPALK